MSKFYSKKKSNRNVKSSAFPGSQRGSNYRPKGNEPLGKELSEDDLETKFVQEVILPGLIDSQYPGMSVNEAFKLYKEEHAIYTANANANDQADQAEQAERAKARKARKLAKQGIDPEEYMNTNSDKFKSLNEALKRQLEIEQQTDQFFSEMANETVSEGEKPHLNLKDVLVNISVGNLVFLVGPAGSGKTTLATQAAKALELDFHFTGAVHQKHELLGFVDANGKYIRTPFRDAFENGGLFLFDEYDASAPNTLTAFNAALSNKKCAFPDGIIDAHDDFVAIAAGNTYGTGATRQYVGRFQQDAAALDRFVFIEIDYDTDLERQIALKEYRKHGGVHDVILDNYLSNLRSIREAVKDLEIQHIVSPRAALMGARLLGVGVRLNVIREIVIFKGMSQTLRTQISSHLSVKKKDEINRASSGRTPANGAFGNFGSSNSQTFTVRR